MIQREEPRLILASASAARRAVLEAAGIRFTTQAAAVVEAAIAGLAATDRH
jgi:septum formation protein